MFLVGLHHFMFRSVCKFIFLHSKAIFSIPSKQPVIYLKGSEMPKVHSKILSKNVPFSLWISSHYINDV